MSLPSIDDKWQSEIEIEFSFNKQKKNEKKKNDGIS